MLYIVIVLIAMYILRKFGWFLSKNGLYGSHDVTVSVICVLWGIGIAYLLHLLNLWQHPNIILKILFGYGFGIYVSIPNYGLVNDSVVPGEKRARHQLIFLLPLSIFILSSIVFSFIN